MAKHRVSIESGNQRLRGRFFVPSNSSSGSAALFIHGFGARGRTCEQYSKQLEKKGIASLTFDLSGHGESTGDNTNISVNDHVKDARNAYDFLVSQDEVAINPNRIGVAGMSYGGYLATLLSSTRLAKSMLLRSPPLYPQAFQDIARREYTNEQALHSEPENENPALVALRCFIGKVSLVTSESDAVVSPATTNAYEQVARSCDVSMLKGAQHWLDADSQQQFQPIVAAWAEEL